MDPHRAATDFPTQFGTNSDVANEFMASLQSPPQPTMESADEFEARLNAAMAAYEEPTADLPTLIADAAPEAPAVEFGIDPGTTTDSFEAQVEAAMHSFDSPDAAQAPAEVELVENFATDADTATLELEQGSAFETPAEHTQSKNLDVVAHSTMPEIAPPQDEFAPHVSQPSSIALPETDESVIQQMREGLSHLPDEPVHIEQSVEAAPMAMAAAAAAAPVSSQPSTLPHAAEAEIQRAMAAAMGHDGGTAEIGAGIPSEAAESKGEDADANHLAGAVEKVMKRELPNLIWKIMAELDLRKRS
jgi:hypothetical protein